MMDTVMPIFSIPKGWMIAGQNWSTPENLGADFNTKEF